MANINDVHCFLFGDAEKIKNIIEPLLKYVGNDKEDCYLDCEKIIPYPEQWEFETEKDKRDWVYKNFGIWYDFSYRIYKNFTYINIKNKNSVSYKILSELSEKHNLPIYMSIVLEASLSTELVSYSNPENGMSLELEFVNHDISHVFDATSYLNFPMMGIKEDVFTAQKMSSDIHVIPLYMGGTIDEKRLEVLKYHELENSKLAEEETELPILDKDEDLFGD